MKLEFRGGRQFSWDWVVWLEMCVSGFWDGIGKRCKCVRSLREFLCVFSSCVCEFVRVVYVNNFKCVWFFNIFY